MASPGEPTHSIPLDDEIEARVFSIGATITSLSFFRAASAAALDPSELGIRVVDESAGDATVPCYPKRTFLLLSTSRYRVDVDGSPRLFFVPNVGHRVEYP